MELCGALSCIPRAIAREGEAAVQSTSGFTPAPLCSSTFCSGDGDGWRGFSRNTTRGCPSLRQAVGAVIFKEISLEDRHARACHLRQSTAVRHKSKDQLLQLPKVCKDKHQRDRSRCWCHCCRSKTVQVNPQKLLGLCETIPPREVGHLKD